MKTSITFISSALLYFLVFCFNAFANASTIAPTLERGYADLVKKVGGGVVNISTFGQPKMMNGPMIYHDERFRDFFEDFFGGRMPPPNSQRKKPGINKSMQLALGTGFVINADEGLILTNFHVIQGADEVKVQFNEDEDDLAPAEIIGRDPELDIALLKVKVKRKLTAIALGDSEKIDVGEYVVAIGNPLGYGHSVSHGILSAKGRRNPEFRLGKYLQTDASINPGNSGGPLVNMRGEVVGINNAIDARAQGIGFAIPINLVKAVLPQLQSKGSVSRGYLGVGAADLSPEIIEEFKIASTAKGVFVAEVNRGSPAEKAGIKTGDVIVAVNGEKITNSQDLTAKITSIPVGSSTDVRYLRNGKEKSVTVLVAERPTKR